MCDVLVSYFSRCTARDAERKHLVEDCQATWGNFSSRANGCFVERLGACLGKSCETVDSGRCFHEATVASDPESFDVPAGEACVSEDDCRGIEGSFMSRCVERFDECAADGDLCGTAVALVRPHRKKAALCLDQGCGGLEDCVYTAMGH